jgi:RNase H-fold protein (predicted Holliday junction resolvase)
MHILETLEELPNVSCIRLNTDVPLSDLPGVSKFEKLVHSPRPANLFGEKVSMNRIIEFELGLCETEEILMTHTTNPLLKRETFQSMIDGGLNKKQRQNKALVDEISATIILQSYMNQF